MSLISQGLGNVYLVIRGLMGRGILGKFIKITSAAISEYIAQTVVTSSYIAQSVVISEIVSHEITTEASI